MIAHSPYRRVAQWTHNILAVDPGSTESAYVFYCGGEVLAKGKEPNGEVRYHIANGDYDVLAIEILQSYGMPVGREVFDTGYAIGRFAELRRPDATLWPVYRKQVTSRFCPKRANDAGVRAAMCERHGGNAAKTVQTGKLAGFKADMWSALAIATYVGDACERGETAPTLFSLN